MILNGKNGSIYIGGVSIGGKVEWTLEVEPNRYWTHSDGDPLWRVPPEAAVLYRDGEGIRRVSNEGMPIPEPDIAWLKRRVNEICWVPA